MELETEIPIWFDGRIKWISNLTTRSTCSDVIQAILSSSSSDRRSINSTDDYVLYECWRGVERPLKGRCRLLKLWNSWSNESYNVTLTLRSREEQVVPTHVFIRQQENKLNKLKRQLKRADRQIEKLTLMNKFNENENHNRLLTYLNLSRSIINLNKEIENQQKLILRLTSDIEDETQHDFFENNIKQILFDVNQTLISSRKLTNFSDEIDQQINRINEDIEKKQILLDELELDLALQENIHIDNFDEFDDDIQIFKQTSSSPPPLIQMKSVAVSSRPTAIVEPSQSISKSISKESLSRSKIYPLTLNNLHIEESLMKSNQTINSSYSYHCQTSNNDESDTGISSIHSNEDNLVTLV